MGREEHHKQIPLACVGSTRSVWATLGLPPLTLWVLSQSTLLRLQIAVQGNCLKWALGCMHFPGLSCSGSGSWVFHKGTDSVGHAFCALPRSEQLRWPGAWRVHSPEVGSSSYHIPHPSHSISWVHSRSAISGVLCVSSGELISGCDPPGGCPLSMIPGRLVSNWEPACSLVNDAISGADIAPLLRAQAIACPPLCFQRGMGLSSAS